MIGLLSILALGFFLGMRHATDPDHVVAVTTIVTRERKLGRAALIGVFWGIGHTLTIFAVGAAIILFGLAVPPRLGLSMELAVGFMLILLGGANLAAFRSAARAPGNRAEPEPDGHEHPHSLAHALEEPALVRFEQRLRRLRLYLFLRPLAVGIVHGLAGSAAVALVVLAAIRDPGWAMAYLLLFGVGTIFGMMLITLSLASAFRAVGRGGKGFSRRLNLASGVISLVFGLVVAYQICFVNGLLSSHPHWTPR